MTQWEEFQRLLKDPKRTPPPPSLADMRWVYDHPEEKGEPEGLRVCREFMKRSAKSFMERLTRLEEEWLAADRVRDELEKEKLKAMTPPSTVVGVAEQIPDEGTARLREIGEQVLRELGL